MTEEVGRLVIVLGVVVVALAVAFVQRRGTSIRRVRRAFVGLEPGVYLFSSDSCGTCAVMRKRLQAAAIRYTEVSAERDAEVFEAQGIRRVPSVARVDSHGTGWLASGMLSEARSRRWLANP